MERFSEKVALTISLLMQVLGLTWALLPLAVLVYVVKRDWGSLTVLALVNSHMVNALSVVVRGL